MSEDESAEPQRVQQTWSARVVGPARKVWSRVNPYTGLVFFVGGFAWDALTLVRIDRLADNLLLAAYLGALAVALVAEVRLARLAESQDGPVHPIAATGLQRLLPYQGWVTYAAQFFFGGLLSAVIVLYAKSASPAQTLVWLGGLSTFMVVNEFLHDHLRAERLRLALFWLVSFSFFLFFVPVVWGYFGAWLTPLALALATVVAGVVVLAMYLGELRQTAVRLAREHVLTWLGVAALVFVADAAGLVPPVPFAVVERGVFHHVERTDEGYVLTYEPTAWWAPWRADDSLFWWQPGDKVWCFTAVFAPTGAELAVWHVWERQREDNLLWDEVDRISLDVRGGRGGGFRTFSRKAHVQPGQWRVRVVTDTGREIGRTAFEIRNRPAPSADEPADTPPQPAPERAWVTRTVQ